MSVMQFRTVDSPVGPLTLAGRGHRLMHLVMLDQTNEPSRRGWQRDAESGSSDPCPHGHYDSRLGS